MVWMNTLWKGWSPWDDLGSLQAELRELAEGVQRTAADRGFPEVETKITDEGARVRALLPGFEPETIDVEVVGDRVRLSAERPEPESREGERLHARERAFGRFERTLRLPFEVCVEHVRANYQRGVLDLELPKSPAEKPRRIPVTTG